MTATFYVKAGIRGRFPMHILSSLKRVTEFLTAALSKAWAVWYKGWVQYRFRDCRNRHSTGKCRIIIQFWRYLYMWSTLTRGGERLCYPKCWENKKGIRRNNRNGKQKKEISCFKILIDACIDIIVVLSPLCEFLWLTNLKENAVS